MLTMRPPPARCMCGMVWRIRLNGAQKWSCIDFSKSTRRMFSSGPTSMMPALLIKTSIPPKRSTTVSTAPNDCPRSSRSHGTGSASSAPRARNSAQARRSSASSRATSATRPPSAAIRRAIARPSPREPPVMRTDFPANEKSSRNSRETAQAATTDSAECEKEGALHRANYSSRTS